ncbi:MAG: MBOAT family protein [Allobaculum sp.]|nr:MBOAT family protein [Allobaculum sp.]MDE5758062.1 hypothetical protein [Allobaculum sp.]
MQLTDIVFLIGFFPITFGLYQLLLRAKVKTKTLNLFLLIVSLFFYAWGSLQSFFILIFVLLWNWVTAKSLAYEEESPLAPQSKKRKHVLWFGVGVNLFVLFIYKYFVSWIGGLFHLFGVSLALPAFPLPIGLSFYIFSSLSYVFDVYYYKADPCSLVDFGLFTAFFSRVNMGPVGHYAQFKDQLDNHPVSQKLKREGAALFLQGLIFKVMLANNFALVFSTMASNTTWLGNLIYGFAYFFELYFDFCGYSRMARGMACFFGFRIGRNFNQPYQATSVQDFWRRWHISLTDWFRDYVYIPLGGNRVSQNRWILNILTVWLLTGIWHGSTWPFVFWGLYQGGLILLERFALNQTLQKLPGFLQHTYVVVAQLIGWTFFSSATLGVALSHLGRYLFIGVSGVFDNAACFTLLSSLGLFAMGIFLCTPLPSKLAQRWSSFLGGNSKGLVGALGYGLCFLICLAMLISQTSQTFLYANF